MTVRAHHEIEQLNKNEPLDMERFVLVNERKTDYFDGFPFPFLVKASSSPNSP